MSNQYESTYLQLFSQKEDLENYVNNSISKKCMVLMVRFPDLLHTCEHKNSCKYRHAFGLDCECVYILMEGINSIVVPDKLLEFSKHEHGHVNAMYIGMDSREVEYSINFDDRFFVVPFECTTPETAVTEIQKLLKFYDDPITI